MRSLNLLFALFLIVPLVELWLLIQVGGVIGVGWTIFLAVATAFVGTLLVRSQGLAMLRRIQAEIARGHVPEADMFEGLMLLLAGAVLLTPGFITDALGLIFLVPMWRRAIVRFVLRYGFVHTAAQAADETKTSSRVINGSFRKEND